MKTFKLKACYPSLPNDWEAGMEIGLGDRNYGYSPCNGKYTDCRKLDNSEVENNPEFWEEVVDKEFEIIALCTNSYFGITTSEMDIAAYNDKSPSAAKYTIHAVRRNKDRKVFTVDNWVVRHADDDCFNPCTTKRKIKSIYIDSFGAFRFEDTSGERGFHLKCFSHTTTFLFKTQDGVEIFKGMPVYGVSTDFQLLYMSYAVESDNDCVKTFSTKKLAKDWIIMNKPMFSLEELSEEINPSKASWDEYREMAKNKLKL